jgi:hypothetical protein
MFHNPAVAIPSQKSLIGKYMALEVRQDAMVDILEGFGVFWFMIYRARTSTDRYIALIVLAKMMNEKLDVTCVTLVTLVAALEYFCGSDAEMDVQASVLPAFDDMRSFLDKYEVIKQSPLFAKVYKFTMYGLSLSLFKPVGVDMDLLKFDKVAQEAVKKQYHMGADFVYCALDTMLFLCERGYQSYQTSSIMPMFHSEAKYQAWYDEAEKLIRQSHFLSNPEVHGIDRFAYLADLKNIIEQGHSMRKCALKKDEKLLITKLLASLELTHDLELTKRAAQKDRKTPLCLLLFGGSGIGKSTLENVIFQHYGKRRGLKTSSDFRYVRNPTEEFWSGMNSTQWCVVLDDIGFLSPKLQTLDPSLAEMLCIANNVPFVPAQAELSDKGRTPVRAELVLGSTNTESLNLSAYFSCPLAVQRRFPWVIDVKVKAEFMSADKPGMLDSSKVPPPVVGEYPDLWHFTIKRVEPVGEERNGQMGRNVEHAQFSNMRDFLRWLNNVIDNHNDIQDIIMAGNSVMEETAVCALCGMPDNWCECMNTQAVDVPAPDALVLHGIPTYMVVEPMSFSDFASTLEPVSSFITRFYLLVYWFWAYSWFSWILHLILGDWWFTSFLARSKHKSTLAAAVVSYGGYRVQQVIGDPAHLKKCVVALTTLMVAYQSGKYLWKVADWMPQGNVTTKPVDPPRVNTQDRDDEGHDPEPKTSGRVRVSYDDPFPFSTDDLSQASLCSQDGETVQKHIERATCYFQSHGNGRVYSNVAVNIRGSVYMLNNHGIPPTTPFDLDITCAPQGTMGTSMRQLLITESMVHRVPEHDLAFIKIRCRPPGTDLTKYMIKAGYTGKVDAHYIGRSINGDLWRRHVPVAVLEEKTWKSHAHAVTRMVWSGKVAVPTIDGDCGAMLFSQTTVGPVILGIHTLGREDRVGAMKVSGEVAIKACDALESVFIARGRIEVSAPSAQRGLIPLVAQSAVRQANRGVSDVIGSFGGEFRQRGRTNVTTTYIEPALRSFGYSANRTKPDMSKTPWILALNDTTRPVVQMDNGVLDAAKAMFIDETSECDLKGVHVYSLHVAINGMPGLDYCDKMNRKSSAGAPYKKSKKHFMYFLNEDISTDMDVTEEIKDTVFAMIETYKRGQRCHAIFCGHLKDEPVTFEKALMGKTRVFTASGIAYTLVVRKYLLSVIVLMQNNRYLFETGPGIVSQSLEWEQVREHITFYGEDRMVAGDYSKFDKRMPANVILAAFDVIYDICRRAGYSEDALKVVTGIANDTAFPVVDFNGDLIEFFGSNPSGHPLTVIINGIVNSLYMRYTYLVLRPVSVQASFRERVHLMTYGDDNIMGVSVEAPWFNHTAIQRVLADVDIGYTMADKEAASIPYIHINECNFLKRTWRWDEDVGAYLAPLDRSSIEKMLTVCVQKKNISPQSHAIQVIGTALREYFFYGKQEYTEKVAIFWSVIDKADLELYVEGTTIPTWEELCEAFWLNSEGITTMRLAHNQTQWRANAINPLQAQYNVEPETTDNLHSGLATPVEEKFAPKTIKKELDQEFEQSSLVRLDDPVDSLPIEEMSVQADVQDSGAVASLTRQQDVLTFHDASESNIGDEISPPAEMTLRDQSAGHNLDDFFKRPVRILNFTWLESDPIGTRRTFSPWNLFFSDPRVQYKLNNFAFISCKLKLKILINASPFYYGSMLCAYRPLKFLNFDTISIDTGTRYFIPYSQRPGVWLAPQRNEGAEMTLPFLYPANWLKAGVSADMTSMGDITFINYTALQSANGVTGSGVTVSVYAWAEDVKLSGPTLSLATQSDVMDVQGDEYGKGPISSVASAIANAAGKLPFLGRFATATQIGAGAVSSIASLFGFTNVPVIADTAPFRPEAFPKFASSEIGFPVEKLTLDPKNELTLDNSVCGATEDDELVISKLVQRESYLCTSTWTTTHVADDMLFYTTVAPCNMWDITTETYPRVYLTPLAWVGAMFQNWRGDLIFRFRIVASKYHKGRLRVSFDPAGQAAQNLVNTAASNNVVFTEIVDLDVEAEVEFRVPFQQAYPFLTNQSLLTPPNWSIAATPTFVAQDSNLFNGTLTLRVLTALTAPVGTSNVAVQVFVRGAENLEYANPTTPPKGFTNFGVQADVMTTTASSSVMGESHETPDAQYLVNFGERIRSLRQVMRRMSLVGVTTPPTAAGSDYYLVQKYFTKIPPFFGYDPTGIHTAKGVVVPATTFKFNFVQPHPINWILPAFAGFRGSTVWSFNVDSSSPVGHVRVNRLNSNSYPKASTAIDAFVTSLVKSTPSINAAFFWNNTDAGGAGQAVTNQNTNAGITAHCPMYTRHKFVGTSADWATAPNVSDESNDMFVFETLLNNNVGASSAATKIWSYCGIGTDFNVLFFVNVPTVTYIGTTMVPV